MLVYIYMYTDYRMTNMYPLRLDHSDLNLMSVYQKKYHTKNTQSKFSVQDASWILQEHPA